MTGYLTLAQSQAELERFIVEMVQAGVEQEKLEELFPGSSRAWISICCARCGSPSAWSPPSCSRLRRIG